MNMYVSLLNTNVCPGLKQNRIHVRIIKFKKKKLTAHEFFSSYKENGRRNKSKKKMTSKELKTV